MLEAGCVKLMWPICNRQHSDRYLTSFELFRDTGTTWERQLGRPRVTAPQLINLRGACKVTVSRHTIYRSFREGYLVNQKPWKS